MPDVFQPMTATLPIAATAVTSAVQIPRRPSVVRLLNTGATLMFVTFGNSSVTTSITGGYPLQPNIAIALEKGDAEYIAVITASGTGTLYVTNGLGY